MSINITTNKDNIRIVTERGMKGNKIGVLLINKIRGGFVLQSVLRRSRMYSYLLLLAFMLIIVLFPLPAYSQGTLKDIQGHWGQETIQKMADTGIIAGNPDGTFNPDGKITRAQFATLLVKAYDLTGNGKVYQDTANHWAKDYIAIASANGIVNGYSTNKFGPDDQITREQMAVMIVKAARLDLSTATSDLTDQSQISSWASAAVATAYANGIIKGLPDGRFAPKENATRAQAAVVIKASLNIKAESSAPRPITEQDYSLIDKAGTYGSVSGTKTIEGNVTIKAKDTILLNLIIKGDLIIAKEVGSGDVTLDNITVEGKTYIRGGGKDSIHINGGKYNEIIIEKTVTGSVRILALDTQGIRVNIAENAKGDEIILEGDIKTIVVKADDVKISTQGDTNIAEFKVKSGLKDVQIELAKDSSVKEMVLDSKVSVTGEGTIKEASGSKVSDAAFTTKPDIIIKPSTGGGGGGSTGSSTIAVNTVTVTGEGGASTITTTNGTLQMNAAITPANASNKNVTWSVINGTGSATISTTGLLTAVSNGTVTVKATAKDGSGKFGETEIIISGQQGAIISTRSTISNGTVNPVVVVTLANDTFKADGVSTLPANWSGSAGTTGLTGGTITRNSDTQITFYLNGTAKAGTLTLQAKAEALTGGLASNRLTVIVPAAPASLESIAITTPASKLAYKVGETLDITGMVVTGTYSDESTKAEEITADNITGFDSSAVAVSQTLTVTVGGKLASYQISIAKADGPAAPSAPTLQSKTHNTVTLVPDETHEFSNDDGATWQNNVFTGLEPATNYTFIARLKATATHEASAASEGTVIKTEAAPVLLPSGDLLDADAGSNFMGVLYSRDGNIYYNQADASGTWGIETLIGTGTEGRLAVDSTGKAHIAYTTSGKIGYRMYDGSAWTGEVLIESNNAGGNTGSCLMPDIAIDSNGKAHITYTDTMGQAGNDTNAKDIMYATNTSGSFIKNLIYNGYYDSYGGADGGGDYYNKGSFITVDSDGKYCILTHHNNYSKSMSGVDRTYSAKVKTPAGEMVLGSNWGTKESADILNVFDIITRDGKLYALYRHSNVKSAELTIDGSNITVNRVMDATGITSAYSHDVEAGDIVIGSKDGSYLQVHYNGTPETFTDIVVKGNAVSILHLNGSFYAIYTDNGDGNIKMQEIVG